MKKSQRKQGYVGVELTGSKLRIVFLRPDGGAHQVSCAEMELLEEGQPQEEALDPNRLAGNLQKVLIQLGAIDSPSAVTLDGDFATVQTVRGSEEEVKKELMQMTIRARHYALLGTSRVAVSTKINRHFSGQCDGMLLAAPHENVDVLCQALGRCGSDPEVVEPSVSSVLRLATVTGLVVHGSPSMLVHLHDLGAEIVVVRSGRLEFAYRSRRRNDANPNKPLVGGLPRDLRRVDNYARRHLNVEGIASKVLLTGDLEKIETKGKTKIIIPGFVPGRIFDPYEEGILEKAGLVRNGSNVGPQYAAAIGAAYGVLHPKLRANSPNLLPSKENVSGITAKLVLSYFFKVAAIPIVIFLVLIGMNMKNKAALDAARKINADNGYIETVILEGKQRLENVRYFSQKLDQLNEKVGQADWAAILEDIQRCIPTDVGLKHIRKTGKETLEIEGIALSRDAILVMRRWLPKSPHIQKARLIRTNESPDIGELAVEFSMECTIRMARTGKRSGEKTP